ncbi:hypothetical protein F444_20723 [Phytophthora nicotianae P1976]|uniref:Uncharacterized protein n=1 Tax=Phytophthora nicotianae P1976 TaxID=1317066 RepID=A0A080Z3N2_PHYNI|nr:hypothetical protein F444_20723 [Phytophthora nicotianae P1976]
MEADPVMDVSSAAKQHKAGSRQAILVTAPARFTGKMLQKLDLSPLPVRASTLNDHASV